MDRRNGENLRELFERFVDSGQAKEAAEDIERGEQIMKNVQGIFEQPALERAALIRAEFLH